MNNPLYGLIALVLIALWGSILAIIGAFLENQQLISYGIAGFIGSLCAIGIITLLFIIAEY